MKTLQFNKFEKIIEVEELDISKNENDHIDLEQTIDSRQQKLNKREALKRFVTYCEDY